MDYDTKVRLARLHDDGMEACAIRLRAAMKLAGKQDQEIATAANVSKTVLSNAKTGATYPNRKVMRYFYREHRIDFNFMLNGDFVQLPGDVQEALFPALEAATNDWDQREGSGQSSQASVRPARS